MAVLQTNLEFSKRKEDNCYYVQIFSENRLLYAQFDSGASNTTISTLALPEKVNYNSKEAEWIEQKLLKRASDITGIPIEDVFQKTNIVIHPKSATGDRIYGFLADMGEITMTDGKNSLQLKHFYYYFVPNNNNRIALLGNDFIDHCELTHAFNGNFIAHAFDEDSYYSNHIGAISKPELNSLVADAHSEISKEQTPNNSSSFQMII